MESLKFGNIHYDLVINYSKAGFCYTLSYIDDDGNKHVINFSHVRDYTDYIFMLIQKYYVQST
jgi:hypothetical protein